MRTRAPLASCALTALLLGACADAAAPLPEDLQCRSDRECDLGLTCSFNHCITPGANDLALKLRITPPPPTQLLPQQIPLLTLGDAPDRLVQLLEPTIVRGTVRPEKDPFAANVEGDIVVRTSGDIPGLDFVFETHSLAGLDVDGFGYSLALLPGRDYVGTFRPTDRTLPRHVFEIPAEALAGGRFDIALPLRTRYLVLTGRVRKSDFTAIAGARIVVLSATGEVAAVTTSEAPRGTWEVLAPPGLTTFSIKTESPADGPVFPEFTTPLMSYVAGAQIDLVVPDLPPGTEPIEAVIRVSERRASADALAPPEIIAAAGRTVTIVGALAGGSLRRTGTTDARGEVRLSALPGAYECLVASPPQARAATWHGFVNFAEWQADAGAEPVAIELSPRVPFLGRVTDAFGRPVTAGTLTLERRLDAREGEALFIAPAPFETRLGDDGYYSTQLDPGTYDLNVAPDPSTGAPHTFETEIVVGEDGLRFDLGLPPPGLLHLTVAGPDGAWIAGAQVELWMDDALGQRRVLAITSTGEDGFVDVLVPHLGP